MKNRRKAVQPFEIKRRKIDIFRNYEANGFEKNQRKFENFSTLISKKSKLSMIRLQGLWVTALTAESCPHFPKVNACPRNWP